MAEATVTSKGRGRPKLYNGTQFDKIVEMVKAHGALKTTESLRSRANSKLSELRDSRVFPKALPISFPTVLRIAKDAGIELKVGRRAQPKAEAVTV